MGELRFDGIGIPFATFVEKRRGRCPEAMAGHLVLGVSEPP
jgi:hypothetical protein